MKTDVVPTYYYQSFSDDFVQSQNQDYQLEPDYQWITNDTNTRLKSNLLYGIGLVAGSWYLGSHFGWNIKNKSALLSSQHRKRGYLLYCNHTQPVGDAFASALATFPTRPYTVVNPSNLDIPHLGNVLPSLGALPTPSGLAQIKRFKEALAQHLNEHHCVVIFPEAHVWPFYNDIRPFPAAAFTVAVENQVPAYTLTTTYQKRKHGNKPRITAYIDGPFWPKQITNRTSKRASREDLRDRVFEAMKQRSKLSTFEFAHYHQLCE